MAARHPVIIRIAILNDYDIVIAGLAAMLADYADRVTVVQLSTSVPGPGKIDVALLDTFGQPDTRARLAQIVAASACKILTYSWVSPSELTGYPSLSADGHLAKDATAEELVNAVEAVFHRRAVVASRPETQPHQLSSWPGQDQGLTPREAEMIALLVTGLSNQEIAERAFLSINSVKTYLRTAYQKMGVSSRSRAVLWGLDNGFPVPPAELVGALD